MHANLSMQSRDLNDVQAKAASDARLARANVQGPMFSSHLLIYLPSIADIPAKHC